ncbi:predicted protein [Coccidioides posadasii str. Silveira]|uniref:Predicted protein n=1 Tax=Coccidioides posadasii (strain RMSCC 757 / Silveira) TaxID=443226 RepID=E9D335_COCPS|nr:predicted protein [Coccidioides posadasii str. Silveira]
MRDDRVFAWRRVSRRTGAGPKRRWSSRRPAFGRRATKVSAESSERATRISNLVKLGSKAKRSNGVFGWRLTRCLTTNAQGRRFPQVNWPLPSTRQSSAAAGLAGIIKALVFLQDRGRRDSVEEECVLCFLPVPHPSTAYDAHLREGDTP